MNTDSKKTLVTEEASGNKTEVSRGHFLKEGERIKIEDRPAVYEIRDPKELALQVDFGFARYDMILRLIDKYRSEKDNSHLDLGCGLGYLMAKVAQRGLATSGTDISRTFLDIAEEKLKHWRLPYGKLIEADLQKHIDLPDSSYDIITSTDVLEHIEQPQLLLHQIRRLLKEDGHAFVSTNNTFSIWWLEKIARERLFSRRCFHPIDKWFSIFTLRKIAQRCGLRIIEVKGTYFLPLARFRRLFSALGVYKKRYEINEWLSGSLFKYFGRDIILVLKKAPVRVRKGSPATGILQAFSLFFRDPVTGAKRHHTPRRILNLLLIKAQLLLRTSRVLGYPTYLVAESTNICNFKCPLCPTGQGLEGRPKGKMSLSNFKRIIDELGGYLYSLRMENWGEPLLNKEIFEMISYARSKKIATSFNTNLSLLNKDSAQRLVLSGGLDYVKVSLDGASEESYLKYRAGGNFNQVIRNIKLLVETRNALGETAPFIEVQFIVMKHNEEEIGQMKKLCSELGVDGLFIEKLRLDMREELIMPDSYGIDKHGEWLPRQSEYSLFDRSAKSRKKNKQVCSWLWTSAVINWDGSMNPCCGFYDTKYDFGNFFNDGFKAVWNGPNYRKARELIGKRMAGAGAKDIACMRCFKYGIIA